MYQPLWKTLWKICVKLPHFSTPRVGTIHESPANAFPIVGRGFTPAVNALPHQNGGTKAPPYDNVRSYIPKSSRSDTATINS